MSRPVSDVLQLYSKKLGRLQLGLRKTQDQSWSRTKTDSCREWGPGFALKSLFLGERYL